jgi:FAD-dependent oxidoreductase domain-containing protein 1
MRYDTVIVGGGVIGSSIAYHLAAAGERSTLVIERDPSYARASSALSASSIRQQFSTPACIRMSQFGFEFLKNVDDHLGMEGEPADISLVERGYLYLANAAQMKGLKAAIDVQSAHQVQVLSLGISELSIRFPWLNSTGLECGALGASGEGWFDGYSLLQAFRRKAKHLGVTYLHDEVVDLTRDRDRITGVQTAGVGLIRADVVIDAAGPNAGAVAAWGGFSLPVVPERRCIFTFSCPDTLDHIPLVIDPSGLYVRPEGRVFLAGGPATPMRDPDPFALEVDYAQFDDFIWPTLADRIPAFERIKMTGAWAGHYEMNLFDHNAVIGWAPGIRGLMLAAGFSGHGMQHSPAAGRGVTELLTAGHFDTLDLSALSPDRLVENRPIVELNII